MKSCCDEYCSTHGCNQGRNCPVRIERIRQAKERLGHPFVPYQLFGVLALCALLGAVVWMIA